MLFKVDKKMMDDFNGISPNKLLDIIGIPWTMMSAEPNSIEKDIISILKFQYNHLIIVKGGQIQYAKTTSIDFSREIETDKLVGFYIDNYDLNQTNYLCCIVLSYINDYDELIKTMIRHANMKAFL